MAEEPENPPRTASQAEKAFADATRRARACQKASGSVLAHMDSVSVARDLDVLRTVLGDARLNYTGVSYGTFIGQQYMKLFPGKVGRMVLDGVVNPAADLRQVARLDLKTSDDAVRRYAHDLVARGDDRLGAAPRRFCGGSPRSPRSWTGSRCTGPAARNSPAPTCPCIWEWPCQAT